MPNTKNGRNIRPTQRCKPLLARAPPHYQVEMACPVCERRAFNLSGHPQKTIWIGLKCPNCRKIIDVRCAPESAADQMHSSEI